MNLNQGVAELPPQKTIHPPHKMWQKSHKKLDQENNELNQKLIELERENNINRLDPLTKLNDRGSFEEFKEKLVHSDKILVFIMFDADKLKQVNDRQGHPVGDIYLQKIANFIRNNIRHDDFAARFGGDEFVAIMPNIDLDGYIERYEAYVDNFYSTDEQPNILNYKQFLEKNIKDHFTKVLEEYNNLLDKEHRIYLSFGVASSFPIPGSTEPRTDIEETAELADRRQYIMKRQHHAQMKAVGEK